MAEALLIRPDTKKTSPLQKVILILVIVLFFLAVMELVFTLVVSPRLRLRQLLVKSDVPLSENEILSIAGLEGTEYYFSVDCEELRKRLVAHPLVREAQVEREFPDTLRLVLYQRKPLILSFGEQDGHRVPVAFDAEGIAFQIGKSITEWDLPVISGLSFEPLLGLQLPDELDTLLERLARLKENAPVLFNQISEIKVARSVTSASSAASSAEEAFEFAFFPVKHPVRVNLGSRLDEELLKDVFLVLDVFSEQGIIDEVKELDFRTGEVVYKLKEGTPR